jgi:succinate dehydrogenase / fumarate reductase flavoprotein subunit
MATYATYNYDVLVIGAGGAGLRAAIEAANAGV